MRKEAAQISDTVFMCSIACLIQASSLLTSFLASITEHDSWMVVLLAAAGSIPTLFFYRGLILRFPHHNLMQILEDVWGPIAGKVLGFAYAMFFMTLTGLNVKDLGDLTKLTMMPDTPGIVLVATCIAVSAYAVRHGLRVVTIYGPLFSAAALFITLLSFTLLLNQMDLANFLPVVDRSLRDIIQGTHVMAAIPMGEIVVFLMITPNVRPSRQSAVKGLFCGFELGVLTLLLVVLRDIAVLGNTLSVFASPPLVTARLTNIGTSITRMEILFAIVLIMLLFFKITFLYYASVMAIAHVAGVRTYLRLVLVTGAFIIAYALTLYPSPTERAVTAGRTIPFAWMILETVIPGVTLLVAKVRKLPKTVKSLAR